MNTHIFNKFSEESNSHVYKEKNYEKNKVLKKIFLDHFDEFKQLYSKRIRPIVEEVIERFTNCGNPRNGYALYECEECGDYLHVPFTCKSRFCPSCGTNRSLDVAKEMKNRCLEANHRHIVFTIPKELRDIFIKHREALDILFEASSNTILHCTKSLGSSIPGKKAKSKYDFSNKIEQFVPGIISTLHTFGRDLKWNPHIHMLVTEKVFGKVTESKDFVYMNYERLRKAFMALLLNGLSENKYITYNQKSILYHSYPDGFYVYAPRKNSRFNSVDRIIKYITRYVSRPVMATSRILNYSDDEVTYRFERHEDNETVTVTENVLDFIGKLIIHIPDKFKNLIRYYGVYAFTISKKQKVCKNFFEYKKISPKEKWANKIQRFFKRNPLKCNCSKSGVFKFIRLCGVKNHTIYSYDDY